MTTTDTTGPLVPDDDLDGADRAADYEAELARIAELIDCHVPLGGRVLVVSLGDETLVPPGQSRLVHFPCMADGLWSGAHPADDVEAIARLEALRTSGATHLVIPATSAWWLQYYHRLRCFLEDGCRLVVDAPDTARIYALTPPSDTADSGAAGPDGSSDAQRRIAVLEELVAELLVARGEPGAVEASFAVGSLELLAREVPVGAVVLVVTDGVAAPVQLRGRTTVAWPARCGHEQGHSGVGCPCAIARIEALRARGAQFLLVDTAVDGRLALPAVTAGHVHGHYRPLARRGAAVLFDLRSRRPAVVGGTVAPAAVVERLALLGGDDTDVLDWTHGGCGSRMGALGLFRPAEHDADGGTHPPLPYLDGSVPLVVIDDDRRRAEATRVASLAVVVIGNDPGGCVGEPVVVEVVPVGEAARAVQVGRRRTLLVAAAGRGASPLDDLRLVEALACYDTVDVASVPPAGPAVPDGIDVPHGVDGVVLIEPGTIPLPGCLDAALALLDGAGANGAGAEHAVPGAVAVKLFAADGSLAGAGATVCADGTWQGTAAGATDVTAPWHEFVRDSAAGAGLLVVRPDVWAALADASADEGDLRDRSAAIWAAGHRVRYQPEALAVQADLARQATYGPVGAGWDGVASRCPYPLGPATELDGVFAWRAAIATADPAGAWAAPTEEDR